MLKLISVNIETNKHYATVVPFLEKEQADVVCLQEAPETFSATLQGLGYHTAFEPMCLKDISEGVVAMGILIASKTPFRSYSVYYHEPVKETVLYNSEHTEDFLRIPYLVAEVQYENDTYNILTTHLIDTKAGKEDEVQIRIFENLLKQLVQEVDHVICGDFNMPRGYNALYPLMTQTYQDTIPPQYKSSLDRNLHRLGNVDIPEKIFDEYMVDYIFTKGSYIAEDVRLEFGISDHAAVIGYIKKVPTPLSHS